MFLYLKKDKKVTGSSRPTLLNWEMDIEWKIVQWIVHIQWIVSIDFCNEKNEFLVLKILRKKNIFASKFPKPTSNSDRDFHGEEFIWKYFPSRPPDTRIWT